MIGFVVALNKEAEPLIEKLEQKSKTTVAGKPCFLGKFCDKEVVLVISGVGKVNSALSTQAIIDKFGVNAVINFGSVGGLKTSVLVKNYYLVDKCFQYDFDLSKLDGVSVGYIQDYDTVYFNAKKLSQNIGLEYKTLASSDRFTCEQKDVDIISSLNGDVFDMEGGAIGQVCLANGVDFYVLKGVTDLFNSGSNQEQFFANLNAVCGGFPSVLEKLVKNI